MFLRPRIPLEARASRPCPFERPVCGGVSHFLFLSMTMPRSISLSEYDVQKKVERGENTGPGQSGGGAGGLSVSPRPDNSILATPLACVRAYGDERRCRCVH